MSGGLCFNLSTIACLEDLDVDRVESKEAIDVGLLLLSVPTDTSNSLNICGSVLWLGVGEER